MTAMTAPPPPAKRYHVLMFAGTSADIAAAMNAAINQSDNMGMTPVAFLETPQRDALLVVLHRPRD